MINNTASYFIHIGDLQIDCSVIASNLSIGLSESVTKKQATFIFGSEISFQIMLQYYSVLNYANSPGQSYISQSQT